MNYWQRNKRALNMAKPGAIFDYGCVVRYRSGEHHGSILDLTAMTLMERSSEIALSSPSDDCAARPSSLPLGNGVMVLHRPLGVASGTPNGGGVERGVAHAQHSKLRRQAIQVQTNAVEVSVGGAPRQRGSHRILCGRVLRDRLLERVQQDGVDVGQFPEHSEEALRTPWRRRFPLLPQ